MARFREQFGTSGDTNNSRWRSRDRHLEESGSDDDNAECYDNRFMRRLKNQRKFRSIDKREASRKYGVHGAHTDWRSHSINNNAVLSVTSSSDDDVSSCSSIDTDDLDFSYQEKKDLSESDDIKKQIINYMGNDSFCEFEQNLNCNAKTTNIELASESMFSDSSESVVDTDLSNNESDYETESRFEPVSQTIFRQ